MSNLCCCKPWVQSDALEMSTVHVIMNHLNICFKHLNMLCIIGLTINVAQFFYIS